MIFAFVFRFDPSPAYKRAQTTLISSTNATPGNVSLNMSSSAGVRRSYAPMSNTTSSNLLFNSSTRKPRAYISSATTAMKT